MLQSSVDGRLGSQLEATGGAGGDGGSGGDGGAGLAADGTLLPGGKGQRGGAGEDPAGAQGGKVRGGEEGDNDDVITFRAGLEGREVTVEGPGERTPATGSTQEGTPARRGATGRGATGWGVTGRETARRGTTEGGTDGFRTPPT